MPTDDLYTVDDVARMYAVDPKTVQRWAKTGKIPAFKTPGGHWRFHRRLVDPILERSRRFQ